MRFYWDNFIDAALATVTASSAHANFPAGNLRNPQRSKPWRTTGVAAAESVTFDLGSAREVKSLILLDHTLVLASDTLVRIQGHASDTWGAPSFTENVTLTTVTWVLHQLSSAQTYRYWRFIFTKPSAATIRDLGRLYLGSYYTPTDPPDWNGYVPGANDLSLKTRGPYGQTFGDARPQYRHTRFDWSAIPNAQKVTMKAATARLGTLTPFFVVADEAVTSGDEVGEPVYVTLREAPDFPHAGYSGESYWNTKWDLDEDL